MDVYERILQRILSHSDLNQPDGIDQAYESCVEYARIHMLKDPNCNSFLQLAAQKLEAVPIHLDRISLSTPIPLGSRLDLYVSDENEIVISGNEEGLGYLAELINRLKVEESNDHLHIDPGEGPLTHRSWPLVIYKEAPEWFDEQDRLASDIPSLPERQSLDPADVIALQFLDPPPHPMKILSNRLYKTSYLGPAPKTGETTQGVQGWEKYFDPGSQDRYALFSIQESGRDMKLLLHLDDPGVLYFKRADLEKLL